MTRATSELDPEAVVKDSTEAVLRRFPQYDAAEVERLVREEFEKLRDRPVQDYLAVLTERAVAQRLRSGR